MKCFLKTLSRASKERNQLHVVHVFSSVAHSRPLVNKQGRPLLMRTRLSSTCHANAITTQTSKKEGVFAQMSNFGCIWAGIRKVRRSWQSLETKFLSLKILLVKITSWTYLFFSRIASSYRKEGSEEDRTGHPSHPRKKVERGETIPSFSRRGQVSSFRITRAEVGFRPILIIRLGSKKGIWETI